MAETSTCTVDGETSRINYEPGQSFTYSYTRSHDPDKPKSDIPDSEDSDIEVEIPNSRIIALTASSSGPEESHTSHCLRYISQQSSKSQNPDSKSHTHQKQLSSLILTNPPDSLLSSALFTSEPKALAQLANPSVKKHVIISTLSGTQQAQQIYSDLLTPLLSFTCNLKQQNDHYTLHTTTSSTTVTELTDSVFLPAAEEGEQQVIILLSGDGGISDLINALSSSLSTKESHSSTFTPPTLILIPCGTGNALANSARILSPIDETHGLRTLVLGSPRPLPTATVTFTPPARPFLPDSTASSSATQITTCTAAVVVSWCLHAALVADSDTPDFRKHGDARFAMAAEANLSPAPHGYRGRVEVLRRDNSNPTHKAKAEERWETIERKNHTYLLATLCSHLQSGFCISPSSKPLDSSLRLLHFGAPQVETGEQVMGVMQGAFEGGKHVEMDGVGYEDVEGVRVVVEEEEERWRRICVDGRILVVEKGGVVEVRRDRGKPLVEIVALG